MRCAEPGCFNDAAVLPKLCCPARGWPLENHDPLGVIFDIKVCRHHFEKSWAQGTNVLHPDNARLREAVRLAAAAVNAAEPDFERAYFAAVPIDGSEHQTFQRLQSRPR